MKQLPFIFKSPSAPWGRELLKRMNCLSSMKEGDQRDYEIMRILTRNHKAQDLLLNIRY